MGYRVKPRVFQFDRFLAVFRCFRCDAEGNGWNLACDIAVKRGGSEGLKEPFKYIDSIEGINIKNISKCRFTILANCKNYLEIEMA